MVLSLLLLRHLSIIRLKNSYINQFHVVYPCRNPAEVSHACRGKISLQRALIHTVDACTFVVSGSQTFHIKAATEVERQEWVTALELAKTKAVQGKDTFFVRI